MEVAPAYDHAEITALAAAMIVWEYLSLMGPPARAS
jgi:agmatinase